MTLRELLTVYREPVLEGRKCFRHTAARRTRLSFATFKKEIQLFHDLVQIPHVSG